MPMSFPDMKSLERAAENWKFRPREIHETEAEYRSALADFVQANDLVESMEIRTGKEWDKFNDQENKEMLLRKHGRW
jgi:hypothetical protein